MNEEGRYDDQPRKLRQQTLQHNEEATVEATIHQLNKHSNISLSLSFSFSPKSHFIHSFRLFLLLLLLLNN